MTFCTIRFQTSLGSTDVDALKFTGLQRFQTRNVTDSYSTCTGVAPDELNNGIDGDNRIEATAGTVRLGAERDTRLFFSVNRHYRVLMRISRFPVTVCGTGDVCSESTDIETGRFSAAPLRAVAAETNYDVFSRGGAKIPVE